MIVSREELSDDEFFAQLLAYLESGFPLFIGMNLNGSGHAIVAAGYSWKPLAVAQSEGASDVWSQVDHLLAVDDNMLPYVPVPVDEGNADGTKPQLQYTVGNFDSFIVALPEKIGFSAEVMAEFTGTLRSMVMLIGCEEKSLRLHRYFMTTISELRRHARNNEFQLGETLVDIFMRLNTTQFVWVVEFSNVERWGNGRVAASAIVVASASHRDPCPVLLLHNEETALIFNRSAAAPEVKIVELGRSSSVPLHRMEVNLQPVRK